MQQTCKQCAQAFEIDDTDLAYYDTVSPIYNKQKYPIPPPTLCPTCRHQRRAAWRNERSYHSRTCSKCSKKIISTYSSDLPFPVYCHTCWWGQDWDPRDYGREIDVSRPFFEQYIELRNTVPQLAMMNDNGVQSENCEYTYDFSFGKNCYLTIGSWFVEELYFCGPSCARSKFAMDCYFIAESELCYECLDSRGLYNCRYLRNCENCSDCLFGYDLKGCRYCFGCSGLRQKEFHWFNEPLSEEEYRKRISAFDPGSYAQVQKTFNDFQQSYMKLPRKAMNLIHCENCTGDSLYNSRDSHNCYLQFNIENCKFCDRGEKNIWCHDLLSTGAAQYCYEGLTPDNSYMTLFSFWTWYTKYVRYSDNCHHSEHLFGCNALKNSKYCILNKQYTQEEYEQLVPKIIERMQADDEWGEALPMHASPYAYNESIAIDYYPLTQQEAAQKGLKWLSRPHEQNASGISASQLPDRINDVEDAILQETILCAESKRPFKIIKQELDLYRKLHVPLPRLHPDVRHRIRFNRHNPQKIWDRECMKCKKDIQTTYPPDRPEIVYCEECYLAAVY